MSGLISIKDVHFAYDSGDENTKAENAAVDGVSLEIERGTVTAILGKNGSGKSTLAKLCNGIYLPDRGSVTVNGFDTRDEAHAFDIKKAVGMVFQNPDNQLVATICEEDVAFGPENLGVPSDEIRRKVDESLALVGMSDYALAEPHRLSGGQKQRIAIAGVLAMQSECIILDESTAMLDPYGRAEVLSVVDKLKEKGIAVVMITHYMEEACLADRAVVMLDGKIVCDGTPIEVFSNGKLLKKAGLCPPQNIELIYKLRENGTDLPISLSLEQTADSIYKVLIGE